MSSRFRERTAHLAAIGASTVVAVSLVARPFVLAQRSTDHAAPDPRELRVCADPRNLPYSHSTAGT